MRSACGVARSALHIHMSTHSTILPSPRGQVSLRRNGSIRRTSTIDVTWSNGRWSTRTVAGAGRDIYTPDSGGKPEVLALEQVNAMVAVDGSLASVRSIPERPQLQALVGQPKLRKGLALISQEPFVRSPLYQLIDDISGAMVVADWAWSQWPDLRTSDEVIRRKRRLSNLEGVCVGFRPGSSALSTEGRYQYDQASAVLPLVRADDPDGWHDVPDPREVSMRRARCMDVWMEDDLQFEAAFQDCATTPEGRRVAVHEYGLRLSVDARTRLIQWVRATPHVLPFRECPGAVDNLTLLVGQSVDELRSSVPVSLRDVLGCTHLNDVLRGLAGVARLVFVQGERIQLRC